MHVEWKCGSWRHDRGQALPLALVLLAAAVFIIVPGLFASQIALGVNRNTEQDSRGYFAAEAGLADALWRFKSTTPPFTPGSPAGSNYSITGTINGATVKVTLLNHVNNGGVDYYYVQSVATIAPSSVSTVISTITQQGGQGTSIFNQAVVSLGGDIAMSGSAQIGSDDTSISSGDAYANGKIYNPAGKFGPAIAGNASATGTIDNHISVSGTSKTPAAALTTPALDVSSYQQQAQQGQTVASFNKSSGTWNLGGPGNPGYITGDLQLTGTATAVITGTVYVGGKITMSSGAIIRGGNTLVSDGDITLNGNASGELPKGTTPLVISVNGNVTVSNGAKLSAIVYAPNGLISLKGSGTVWGATVGKSISMVGGSQVVYETSVRGWTQLPGSGQGVVTSMKGYDYH
jgi:hypothetical protein